MMFQLIDMIEVDHFGELDNLGDIISMMKIVKMYSVCIKDDWFKLL